MRIIVRVSLAATVFLVIVAAAACAQPIAPAATGMPESTSSPVNLHLEISKAPRLDEEVILRCVVEAAFDAPHSWARIELPEGAVLVDGKTSWEGDLSKEVPVELQATIKFVEDGNWTIKAVARHDIDETNWWGDTEYIYLYVTQDHGRFGFGTVEPGEEAED